jgi:aldehyde dehydrogenase (NAD+)
MNQHSMAPASGGTLPLYRNLIGGKSAAAQDGAAIDVLCPSDGMAFATLPRSSAADVDQAVKAARGAFEGAWGKLTALERGRLLMKLGRAIEDNAAELAALESRDAGKPLKQGKADIVAAARYFEYYGAAADKLHGDTIPFLDGYTVLTVREPHGVAGHIIPWNYPAQMFCRTVAPALACGNACVVKPAEDACLNSIRFAELARDVGFPNGVINIVAGLGHEAGAALSAHPGIDFISFTGSPETGALIQTNAARNHIGCTLELGGKSPQIVFADADFEKAAPSCVNAIIQNAGQTCSAGSRVLIERKAYDAFVFALAHRFSAVRIGHHEMDLDAGPLISARQKQRVENFVARARQDGVPVLAEAAIAPGSPASGFYVAPVMFGPVPRGNSLASDEVFGPVLSVMPFDDEADAVRLANGTPYGLVAGIWTGNAARSMRVARAMRCGQVFVNGYGAGGGIELPFGGVKKSGHGREKGFEALHEFSASKTIVINHG